MSMNSNELFKSLKTIINLPENGVISLDLHLDIYSPPEITLVTYAENDLPDNIVPSRCINKFVIVRPWQAPNKRGEYPGGICCQRSAPKFCFEHDEENYEMGLIK